MNEMDVLSRHRPATLGPSPDLTEAATRTFGEFLDSQNPATAISSSTPTRARWRRRPLVIAGMAVILLAVGGVAVAVIGDSVVYVEPATQIIQTGDLTLVLQESNIGPCLEVRIEGGIAGGCGADFDEPLSVGVGSIGETTFASGWAPPGTAGIEMVFPGGEIVKVAAFESLEGYDVVFFVVLLPASLGFEVGLPLDAVALDDQGNTLATVSYTDEYTKDSQYEQ